ncbi:MAG: hypothetical protein FJZ01_08280 [Candidatus Sericytochromatia bacterium]|nr:hypothetical protein [Candidatus Tanganyikabacteria bacterium]
MGLSKLIRVTPWVTPENAAWWAEQLVKCTRAQLDALIDARRARGSSQGSSAREAVGTGHLTPGTIPPSASQSVPALAADDGRAVPAAIEVYLMARSGGLCERLGCDNRAAQIHHCDPYSEHHTHDPDRMLAICADCHAGYHSGLLMAPLL